MQEAFVLVINPPPVRGIGTGGGFKMYVEDRRGRGLAALEAATNELVAARQPGARGLAAVFTLFNTAHAARSTPTSTGSRPRCWACRPSDVFETLNVYLGSSYVNDFNYLGRTYRVQAQADGELPPRGARHRQPQDPERRAATWCRSARSRPSGT